MNETMKAVIRYLDALGLSKSIRNIKEEMSKIYKYINYYYYYYYYYFYYLVMNRLDASNNDQIQ